MSKIVSLTISGQKFTLSQAEAKFISEHLRTAVAQPDLAFGAHPGPERGAPVRFRFAQGA